MDVDLAKGAHKQADFLAKNSFGQVPVLEDADITLADSNAILVYPGGAYDISDDWYPQAPATAAAIQRFLSIAAGPLVAGPATARLINVFGAALNQGRATMIATDLLTRLDAHLSGRQWLVSARPTIAGIANYTYIAHAPEGDFPRPLPPHPGLAGAHRSVAGFRAHGQEQGGAMALSKRPGAVQAGPSLHVTLPEAVSGSPP